MKNFDFNPYDVFGVPETKGKLKVDRATCPKSEYLECSEELMDLAEKVLDGEGIEEAENLSNMLVGTKRNKENAIKKLKELVAPPPKRPLYYCQHHIQGLPHWTRDSMRYLGDYIDVLVKEMSFEFTGNEESLKSPLGRNLRIVKDKIKIPDELYNKLSTYNHFLYVPGKHDFNVPANREHRFTSKEVVIAVFVTMKLASEIKSLSKMAREYSEKI